MTPSGWNYYACLALGGFTTIEDRRRRDSVAYLDSKRACTFKIDCFMTATQDTQDHPQASWSCIGGPVQIFARLRRHVCTALASRPKHPSGDGFHLVMALFPKPVAGAVVTSDEFYLVSGRSDAYLVSVSTVTSFVYAFVYWH